MASRGPLLLRKEMYYAGGMEPFSKNGPDKVSVENSLRNAAAAEGHVSDKVVDSRTVCGCM